MSAIERESCNGNCPFKEDIIRKRDNYLSSQSGILSTLDPFVNLDLVDRFFNRALEEKREVDRFVNNLPLRCRKCFWSSIDPEDLE